MIYRRRVFKVLADPEPPVSKDGSAGESVNDTAAELSQSQEDLPSEEAPNDTSE